MVASGSQLALSFNYAGPALNDGGIGGDILEHNRIGADLHIVADRDPTENLGPGPDDHVIAKRGSGASLVPSRPPSVTPWKRSR